MTTHFGRGNHFFCQILPFFFFFFFFWLILQSKKKSSGESESVCLCLCVRALTLHKHFPHPPPMHLQWRHFTYICMQTRQSGDLHFGAQWAGNKSWGGISILAATLNQHPRQAVHRSKKKLSHWILPNHSGAPSSPISCADIRNLWLFLHSSLVHRCPHHSPLSAVN